MFRFTSMNTKSRTINAIDILDVITSNMTPEQRHIFTAHEVYGVSFTDISQSHKVSRQRCQQKNSVAKKRATPPVNMLPQYRMLPIFLSGRDAAVLNIALPLLNVSGKYRHMFGDTYVRDDNVSKMTDFLAQCRTEYNTYGIINITHEINEYVSYAMESLKGHEFKSGKKNYLIRDAERDRLRILKMLSAFKQISIDKLYEGYSRYVGRDKATWRVMSRSIFNVLIEYAVSRWDVKKEGGIYSSDSAYGDMSFLSKSEEFVLSVLPKDGESMTLSSILYKNYKGDGDVISIVQISKTVKYSPLFRRTGHGKYGLITN